MDSKITLNFNSEVIKLAKAFAERQNISLSRLTEFLYRKMTSKHYQSLEDLPIADWVNIVSEGQAEYRSKRKPRSLKREFYESRKQ